MNYCTSKDYQADQIYNFLLALHCIHDFFALLLHMDRYLVPAVPKVLKNIQKTVRVKTSLQMMCSKLFRSRIFRILKIPAVLGLFMSLLNNFKHQTYSSDTRVLFIASNFNQSNLQVLSMVRKNSTTYKKKIGKSFNHEKYPALIGKNV